MTLSNQKSPCKDCPFRKDSFKGWLGEQRMVEILKSGSFTCHKNSRLQCAGHMMLGENNAFVQIAQRLGVEIELKGTELVFDNPDECIHHHTRSDACD